VARSLGRGPSGPSANSGGPMRSPIRCPSSIFRTPIARHWVCHHCLTRHICERCSDVGPRRATTRTNHQTIRRIVPILRRSDSIWIVTYHEIGFTSARPSRCREMRVIRRISKKRGFGCNLTAWKV
jgi:hypothetical protein